MWLGLRICVVIFIVVTFLLLLNSYVLNAYYVSGICTILLWLCMEVTLSNIKIMSRLKLQYDLEIIDANLNHPCLLVPHNCCCGQMYNVDDTAKKWSFILNCPSLSLDTELGERSFTVKFHNNNPGAFWPHPQLLYLHFWMGLVSKINSWTV